MAWLKDYVSTAFLVIALHLLPWAMLALIAYYGRLGVIMLIVGVAFECAVWYTVEKKRVENYIRLLLSDHHKWDIDKSIQEYLAYIRKKRTESD